MALVPDKSSLSTAATSIKGNKNVATDSGRQWSQNGWDAVSMRSYCYRHQERLRAASLNIFALLSSLDLDELAHPRRLFVASDTSTQIGNIPVKASLGPVRAHKTVPTMLRSISLLCLLLALFVGVGQGCRPGSFNGFDVGQAAKAAMDVSVPVTSSWSKFYFTNANSRAFPTYAANVTAGNILQIVDYFCSGDQFRIQITSTTIINSSVPLVPASCSTYQATPDGAFLDPTEFSRATFNFIGAGNLTFTIVVMVSPFSAGAGAIRLI